MLDNTLFSVQITQSAACWTTRLFRVQIMQSAACWKTRLFSVQIMQSEACWTTRLFSVQIMQSAACWTTRLLSMNGETFGILYSVKFHYKQSVYRKYAVRNTVRVHLHSSRLYT